MQFIDLKAQYEALKSEIDANIQSVLNAAQFIGGPYIKELEDKLADYVGRKYCISCANGTEALQLAFMAYGVGQGDAVFCPDATLRRIPIISVPRAWSGRSKLCWPRVS